MIDLYGHQIDSSIVGLFAFTIIFNRKHIYLKGRGKEKEGMEEKKKKGNNGIYFYNRNAELLLICLSVHWIIPLLNPTR